MWRRVRGQVEELLVRRRTRSRPARPSCGRRRGGCRPRLRTRRPPSWASAQWSVAPSPMVGVAVLERDDVPGQLLEARHRAASRPAERRPRACRRRRPAAARVGATRARRDELLDERGVGALAEVDEGAGERGRGPAAPTAQRMTIGRSRRTPAGTSTTTPWLHSARVSWANLSSAGSAPPSAS